MYFTQICGRLGACHLSSEPESFGMSCPHGDTVLGVLQTVGVGKLIIGGVSAVSTATIGFLYSVHPLALFASLIGIPALAIWLRNVVFWRSEPRVISDPALGLATKKKEAALSMVFEGVAATSQSLEVQEARAGWPITYPIPLHNIKDISLGVHSYSIVILLDDVPCSTVTWQSGEPHVSNGAWTQSQFNFQPTQVTVLRVPVLLASVTSVPVISSEWGAKGYIDFFDDDGEPRRRQFDLSTDGYRFPQEEWKEILHNARPTGSR